MNFSSLKTAFISQYVFPVYHILKRDGLMPIAKEYEKNQWIPCEKIKEKQIKKLESLLQYCQKNNFYYSRVFKEMDLNFIKAFDYESFLKIPFLTKQIINNNRDKLISDQFSTNQLIKNSTSGSTGESLFFYNDVQSTLCRQAVVLRNQGWVGCNYADREARLWGASLDLKKADSLKNKIHSFINNNVLLSSYELSNESMEKYVSILLKHKPKLLISYPSPLATFADFLKQHNHIISSVQSIITSAETLYGWQRNLIEEVFNCKVYDRYGCREFGNIAHECDCHQGYHINMERFFIEVLDENGQPSSKGEIGEIFVTDLDNFGFPFIRYKIGDMGALTDKTCTCGRNLSMFETIEGRSFDIIKAPNGNRVAGTFWTIALRQIPGIQNFQINQVSDRKLILKIEKSDGYSFKNEKKIRSMISDKCGGETILDIQYVDKIPLTGSGKRRIIISQIN